MKQLDRLIEVITDVAGGRYSGDIMDLTRPDVEEPVRTIAEAMGLMMVKVEAREFHLAELIEQLEEVNRKIRRNTIATVSTMAKALAARDAYTEGHAERVGRIAGLLAAEIGLDAGETERVELAGLLHDIGKIGFPDSLFLPHEGDNPKEVVSEITRHPATGAEILKGLDFLGPALAFIRYHHERPDGRGYPEHLKGDDVPLGARIIAVADAFDAITTDRPYQKARTYAEALAILKDGAGTKWDADCVAAFERCPAEHPCAPGCGRDAGRNRLLCLWDGRHEDIAPRTRAPRRRQVALAQAGSRFLPIQAADDRQRGFLLRPGFGIQGHGPAGVERDCRRLPPADGRNAEARLPRRAETRARCGPPALCHHRPQAEPPGAGRHRIGGADRPFGSATGHVVVRDGCDRRGDAYVRLDDRRGGRGRQGREDHRAERKVHAWGSAEDAFQFWADRLKAFLDQVHDHK